MKRTLFAKGLFSIMLLLALGALPGCGEKEQSQRESEGTSGKDVKEEVKEAYDTTKDYTQEQIQVFREQTENKLAEYKDKIDQLEAKTEDLSEDAKTKAEQQLAALRRKRDEVTEKLKALSSSGKDAWGQVKSGIDAAMDELGNAYEKAVAEFSKS
jgi:hypothetical protein